MENNHDSTVSETATAENGLISDDQSANFNRIAMSSTFKNQICSQIADSTDSLPTWGLNHHRASNASETSVDSTALAAGATNGNAKANMPDTSGDMTPMPKSNDPLAEAGGVPASRSSTRQLSTVDSRKTVTINDDKRPNPLRRLTTKIRRTISQGQGKTPSN